MVTGLSTSDVWGAEAAERYDAGSRDRFASDVLDPTVDFLAELAGSGAALEFAIGTGRVGVPLAARGVPVTGIELSAPMVAQLRGKVDEASLPVVIGDMATTTIPGEFSLVYLVFNTISNLRTQQEQVDCFRNAARHLSPGGRFVIELWVPPVRRLPPGQLSVPMSLEDGHLIFDTYDLVTQQCTSHHYRPGADGTARYDSGDFRFIWPSECDLMAQLAGLEFEARFADWDRTEFTSDSESHVRSGVNRRTRHLSTARQYCAALVLSAVVASTTTTMLQSALPASQCCPTGRENIGCVSVQMTIQLRWPGVSDATSGAVMRRVAEWAIGCASGPTVGPALAAAARAAASSITEPGGGPVRGPETRSTS